MQEKRKKIAFVVIRYGKNIDGGAEVHCKMLAKHLEAYYDVEVLTTCIKNYKTGINEFNEGVSYEENILTRRFNAEPIQEKSAKEIYEKSKIGRKIRRFIYRLGLLRVFSFFKPIWSLNEQNELIYMKSNLFYSPKMFDYISENKENYNAFIFITYAYPLPLFGTADVADKSIFIPTAHHESALFFSIYTKLFNRVKHIAFNTTAEQELCKSIFGRGLAQHSVVGVGIETQPSDDWSVVKLKYNLPESYLLYLGRVDYGKLNNLINLFLKYKKIYPSSLKLVLTGGIHTEIIHNEDIIYTGFVSEGEKSALLNNATVIVNPSRYESLSLIALEAMWLQKPLLVNGACEVLKEHCVLSKGAAQFYLNEKQFCQKLNTIINSEIIQKEMGIKGHRYVKENYDWNVITEKFRRIIESL